MQLCESLIKLIKDTKTPNPSLISLLSRPSLGCLVLTSLRLRLTCEDAAEQCGNAPQTTETSDQNSDGSSEFHCQLLQHGHSPRARELQCWLTIAINTVVENLHLSKASTSATSCRQIQPRRGDGCCRLVSLVMLRLIVIALIMIQYLMVAVIWNNCLKNSWHWFFVFFIVVKCLTVFWGSTDGSELWRRWALHHSVFTVQIV